ncbi:MAG: hypothetical protein KF708_12325 [Pirellulales bacterium]|nr:hypothetical protein [Pirellulales bacterium]
MSVVCLSSDLGTSSRLAGAAARAGVPLATAMSAARLFDLIATTTPRLVVIDLTTAGLDVAEVVSKLRSADQAPELIFAFGPHVHAGALQAASDAGCDQVLTRGQMHAQADELLRQYGAAS